MVEFLTCEDGETIAYSRLKGKGGDRPGVVFLHGFMSDMAGAKALALEEYCAREGLDYVRFDCTGHGQSSGAFERGTIGRWSQDVVTVLDQLTEGPQILVGSSMGGWLMILAALQRKTRIAGLIGIASAPDFTEKLMWDELSDDIKHTLQTEGIWYMPSNYCNGPITTYPIAMNLIEEARRHLLLDAPIALTCPVMLLHGMKDEDVPWRISEKLAARLESKDVEIALIKSGDHRLSEPEYLALLQRKLGEMVRKVTDGY